MSHLSTLELWDIKIENAIEYLDTCEWDFQGISLTNGNEWINHFKKNGVDYYFSNMDVINFHEDGVTPDEEDYDDRIYSE